MVIAQKTTQSGKGGLGSNGARKGASVTASPGPKGRTSTLSITTSSDPGPGSSPPVALQEQAADAGTQKDTLRQLPPTDSSESLQSRSDGASNISYIPRSKQLRLEQAPNAPAPDGHQDIDDELLAEYIPDSRADGDGRPQRTDIPQSASEEDIHAAAVELADGDLRMLPRCVEHVRMNMAMLNAVVKRDAEAIQRVKAMQKEKQRDWDIEDGKIRGDDDYERVRRMSLPEDEPEDSSAEESMIFDREVEELPDDVSEAIAPRESTVRSRKTAGHRQRTHSTAVREPPAVVDRVVSRDEWETAPADSADEVDLPVAPTVDLGARPKPRRDRKHEAGGSNASDPIKSEPGSDKSRQAKRRGSKRGQRPSDVSTSERSASVVSGPPAKRTRSKDTGMHQIVMNAHIPSPPRRRREKTPPKVFKLEDEGDEEEEEDELYDTD